MKKECWNCVYSEEPSGNGICATCFSKYDLPPSNWGAAECWKPDTHADRIRSMTDEELAEWLVGKTFYRESAWSEPSYLNFLTGRSEAYKDAVSGTKEWLQQPEEEDT